MAEILNDIDVDTDFEDDIEEMEMLPKSEDTEITGKSELRSLRGCLTLGTQIIT